VCKILLEINGRIFIGFINCRYSLALWIL